ITSTRLRAAFTRSDRASMCRSRSLIRGSRHLPGLPQRCGKPNNVTSRSRRTFVPMFARRATRCCSRDGRLNISNLPRCRLARGLVGSAAVLQKRGSAQEVKTREPNKRRETAAAANRNKPLIERVDPKPTLPPGEAGKDYTPVITPINISLPWKIVDGVKVYHLVAEEVDHEFAPGMRAKCWGFNGHVHGPTIEAVEGDRVRIYVTNNLPEATSVHWHGILLPNGMDGDAGLTQKNIQPGETFRYEFTLRQHGTQMYHSHSDEMTQMALGTMGLFIIHPRRPRDQR